MVVGAFGIGWWCCVILWPSHQYKECRWILTYSRMDWVYRSDSVNIRLFFGRWLGHILHWEVGRSGKTWPFDKATRVNVCRTVTVFTVNDRKYSAQFWMRRIMLFWYAHLLLRSHCQQVSTLRSPFSWAFFKKVHKTTANHGAESDRLAMDFQQLTICCSIMVSFVSWH